MEWLKIVIVIIFAGQAGFSIAKWDGYKPTPDTKGWNLFNCLLSIFLAAAVMIWL
jgi:hypothetical protein